MGVTSSATDSNPTVSPAPSSRLPLGGLLAIAAVVFTAVVTEIAPAGLMAPLSADLGIRESQVGALVAVFALTSAVAAIPLTALTRSLPRRPLFVVLVVGFSAVNVVTALASSFELMLAARVVGGALAGLMWSMAPGFAMRLVGPEQSGKALSVAMVGVPLAFALGLPLATTIGAALGWRAAFLLVAAAGIVLAIWLFLALPTRASETAGARASFVSVLRMRGIVAVLATTAAFVLAHNVAYTYIAPLTVASGVSAHLDIALLIFGVMAVVGILSVGALVDRHLRTLVVVAVASLGVAMLVFALVGGQPVFVYLAIGLWGAAYGGAPTLFQTAPARIAGPAADVAQSMIVTTWNGCIAFGAFFGGLILDWAGVGMLPWVTLALLAVAASTALSSRAAFALR